MVYVWTPPGWSGSSEERLPTGVPKGEFSSTFVLDNVRLTGASLTSEEYHMHDTWLAIHLYFYEC